MDRKVSNVISFNIYDFIRAEYKLILGIMMSILVCFGIYQFQFVSPVFQKKIFIKLPQYIFLNPDRTTALNLAKNANVVSEDYDDVEFSASIVQDTTILQIDFTGKDEANIEDFISKYENVVLPELNQLTRERFMYEWQLRNAQSDQKRIYKEEEKDFSFANAQVIVLKDSEIEEKPRHLKSKILATGLGSLVLGLAFGIIHYMYQLRSL